MPSRRLPGDRATVAFAVVTLIWGSTWLVIKGQIGVVPPEWSIAYRFAIAAVTLAGFTVLTGRWQRPTLRGNAFAAVTGLFQFTLNFNFVYAAETRLASGVVALVFALLVVPNAVLAAVFLRTRLTGRFAVGAGLAIAGLGVLFAPDLLRPVGSGGAAGLLLVVAAVAAASVGNVLQAGGFARTLPPLPSLTLALAYGAAFDAGYAAIATGPPRFDGRGEYWLGLVYLALAASVLAFTLYYDLIRRIGPGDAAYTSVLTPVIALLLSTLFEHFVWTWPAAIGVAATLGGVAVAVGARRSGVSGTRAAPRENSDTAARSPAAAPPSPP